MCKKTSVFQFWCLLQFVDFSVFRICTVFSFCQKYYPMWLSTSNWWSWIGMKSLYASLVTTVSNWLVLSGFDSFACGFWFKWIFCCFVLLWFWINIFYCFTVSKRAQIIVPITTVSKACCTSRQIILQRYLTYRGVQSISSW